MNLEEFDSLFHQVSNWGRWGPDDERGTLNFLTPSIVANASKQIRTGKTVSMARLIDTVASLDNPNPAIHHMTRCLQHDSRERKRRRAIRNRLSLMACHGCAHSHFDALCHVALQGRTVQRPTNEHGDLARCKVNGRNSIQSGHRRKRGTPRYSRLEERQVARTGRCGYGRRIRGSGERRGGKTGRGRYFRIPSWTLQTSELNWGAWDVDKEGRAGLHPTAMKLLSERKIAAFFPNGDGEVVPSPVESISYPVHALQIASMGLACADILQLEELRKSARAKEGGNSCSLSHPSGFGAARDLVNPIGIF